MRPIKSSATVLLAAWLLVLPFVYAPAMSLATVQERRVDPDVLNTGTLHAIVTDETTGMPVGNAAVSVQEAAISARADNQGVTPFLSLSAPDRAYSFEPDGPQFFAEYTVDVDADGYRPVRYRGVRIIAGEEARLYATLTPLPAENLGATGLAPTRVEITIPEHALWSSRGVRDGSGQVVPELGLLDGLPAPAGSEASFDALDAGDGVWALETPPATIVVHDGDPTDGSAPNITVSFEEYVKGVLPNEWIPGWPQESLLSGALAVRSYAMHVVRAGKYRGYPFDITSTAFDQVWNPYERCASTDSAVDATAGRYIAYNGLAIDAQYRARTGSPTRDYSSYAPYLKGIWDQVEADHGNYEPKGPGMSQYGSMWWANLGYNHEWIAKHYYTGVGLLPAATTLSVSNSSLSFLSLMAGFGGTTQARTIAIGDNVGGGAVWSAAATSDRGWLAIQASGDRTPASLVATASPTVNGSPLPKGVYQGSITISAPGTANPLTTVPVSYVLTDRIYYIRLPGVYKGAVGW